MAKNLHFSKSSILFLAIHVFLVILSGSFTHASHFSKSIQGLEGSLKGQRVSGLNEVKRYLNRFGYLGYETADKHSIEDDDDEFDEGMESALKMYQKYYNLKVTGRLDSDTIKQMNVPRCGEPDTLINGGNHVLHPQYAFFKNNAKWPPSKRHLTYTFNSTAKAVRMEILNATCYYAFKRWEAVTNFRFQEAPQGTKSDLVIGFHRGDHGDGTPFDGPGGVLAHAYSPTIGQLHYDADEKWSLSPKLTINQTDIVWVAMHEIGHLLGLNHTQVQNAIMFAYVKNGVTRRGLHPDDIRGIRALYAI
ncbi:hypothetical protein I3842_03G079700 [Carya illinoinensis]|uniref:Peptidase metallopeptidase domain-containing protein n=1 Tax=Carya illinoinensis TaxID=32201 RepID=A0A922FIC7_CARIL|nr:hypothetical protein I3842_03G079700 [Carya illinoinensis]